MCPVCVLVFVCLCLFQCLIWNALSCILSDFCFVWRQRMCISENPKYNFIFKWVSLWMQKKIKSITSTFTKFMENKITARVFSVFFFFFFRYNFFFMRYINFVVHFLEENAKMPCIKYLQQKLSLLFLNKILTIKKDVSWRFCTFSHELLNMLVGFTCFWDVYIPIYYVLSIVIFRLTVCLHWVKQTVVC